MKELFFMTQMDELVEQCQDYIDSSNPSEQKIYQDELDKVSKDWSKFIQSGIFHDAIGKVVEVKSNAVFVVTEY